MGIVHSLILGMGEGTKLNYAYFWLVISLAYFPLDSSGGEGKGPIFFLMLFGEADDHWAFLLLLFERGLLSLHWKMQIKLDLYVNVYIVQGFLLNAKFKTTHCPFGGVPAGPKIGW